jgi:hypothetical protein
LNPHKRQVPLSRFLTCCRTYQGLLRIFHSCTHASPQNVRRGGMTGPRHQRQIGSPTSFRSGLPHWSAVTTRWRLVLTGSVSGAAASGFTVRELEPPETQASRCSVQ